MDIKAAALLAEMQSLQGEARNMAAVQETAPRQDFAELLGQAVNKVNGLQQTTGDLRTRFELGDPAVGLEQVMISAQKSSIAFDATVQVRNKLVESYKTIMNMPV
ncbi:flagellar hook-basal body complex protein FliE [Oceanimonas baumannii]|uniref:Flagellar hook-basal body complex protein FliE n=1 Tax=Oceanimonas baumannii TaxID=129578 RepID=A0A235CPI7_9GAMM|nr:flagellar hook-basal body complex protein FliE [Oceanimonas baumannii]MCC4263183.1 flagellar hook-basal body complex protein FliE [Oceanimonas baumannii]OYD25907.1 flagellar hook-basal body complex protein FliE [Oceanimonas baumannii]TDW60076.1 flagellar hook-basal body complex protein FliE [Oceanimonas baumannii]